MKDVLGYEGKRVIVSGAASGMGAATSALLVELGAEVHAIDIKKPDMSGLASFTEADLREPAQIDAAVAKIGAIVNALFNCAGLPNTFSNLDVIPNIVEGGAIASIASSAGIGWLMNMETLGELLATPDFESAKAWCAANPRRIANGYGLSKEAINAYTAVRSFTLAPQGIRLNCLNPGPTDTPMMPHFETAVGKDFMANFPKPLWGRNARPAEQAWPLLFLNSPRASYVTGVQLDADAGFKAGIFTGQIDPSTLIPEGM
jgi:NAD(P)-dependent dehydrogenase (short-subunit alcohol dehydrogenase family)